MKDFKQLASPGNSKQLELDHYIPSRE